MEGEREGGRGEEEEGMGGGMEGGREGGEEGRGRKEKRGEEEERGEGEGRGRGGERDGRGEGRGREEEEHALHTHKHTPTHTVDREEAHRVVVSNTSPPSADASPSLPGKTQGNSDTRIACTSVEAPPANKESKG